MKQKGFMCTNLRVKGFYLTILIIDFALLIFGLYNFDLTFQEI